MSRLFGSRVVQNGYVVRDLEAAIHRWSTVCGVGPFFRSTPALEYFRYGESEAVPHLELALSYFGDLQIELIAQLDELPSPFLDFLRRRGEGLQHVAVWSDTYDADLDRLRALGRPPDLEGSVADVGRFAYFNTGPADGMSVEIADVANGVIPAMIAPIKSAAENWDGADPIR